MAADGIGSSSSTLTSASLGSRIRDSLGVGAGSGLWRLALLALRENYRGWDLQSGVSSVES